MTAYPHRPSSLMARHTVRLVTYAERDRDTFPVPARDALGSEERWIIRSLSCGS